MINQFEAQTQLECAAVISLLILLINILLKLIMYMIKRFISRGQKAKSVSEKTVKSVPEKQVLSVSG